MRRISARFEQCGLAVPHVERARGTRRPEWLDKALPYVVAGFFSVAADSRAEPSTIHASAATASVRLVTLETPGTVDEVGTLPTSQTVFNQGDIVFVELWGQTPEPDGFTQISADINFDQLVLEAVSITPTALFNFGPSGTISNESGVVDNLSGAHPPVIPACSDQVGVAPTWARVAIVEMRIIGSGSTSLVATAAQDGIHFVAICGQLLEPTVDFLGAELAIAPAVPAITNAGVIVLGILFLAAGANRLKRVRDTGFRERGTCE